MINLTIPLCPGCGEPAHATESDDDNYHEGCRDREGCRSCGASPCPDWCEGE